MKLYLANMFSLRAETEEFAASLTRAGHKIVSSWVFGNEEHLTFPGIAQQDLAEVAVCDAVVKFSQPYGTLHAGGGRHFEAGYALGLGKLVFVVGPHEQIFDWHPHIINFPTLDFLMRYLNSQKEGNMK
jgi:nucleoside 2-deoxyribosyltransferase